MDNNSLEYAMVQPSATGVELGGSIVAIHEDAPL
jgi:hypothetical protein